MRIVAGIATWCDGDALLNALASLEGVVDDVVIADGLIDGVDAGEREPFTPYDELRGAADAADPVAVAIMQRTWPTQSAQCDYLLSQARALEADWLLKIDADEQLVNGDRLRPWLDVWGYDAFPLPFYFDTHRQAQPAAYKCLHVPDWRRFSCQGSILENHRGEHVRVMGQSTWADPAAAGMPYLIHRPELRPEWRQSIRLSEHEVTLEPYPDDVRAWREPVYAPALLAPGYLIDSIEDAARLGVPLWCCPGCGRRYAGPGSCTVEHQPIGLEPVNVASVCTCPRWPLELDRSCPVHVERAAGYLREGPGGGQLRASEIGSDQE